MSRSHLIVLYLPVLLLLTGCRDKEQEKGPGAPKEKSMISVSRSQFEYGDLMLGNPEERSFPIKIQAAGMIDVPPQNKAVVSAFMGGYIKETPLLVGDLVKKGQILVSLENPEFITLQQNYLEAKQQLSFLEADYQRQKQLVAENISSQKNFLKAESEYKAKLAEYNSLKEKLQMLNYSISSLEAGNIRSTTSIYAPISGSITKMKVSKGMYVSPSDEILEITDNDHIHLELQVFEKDIMALEKGQLIKFTIPEASRETFDAEVYLIGAHIDENRTVKVHAHLKKEDHRNFLTGMFVEAEIITSQDLQKALPEEAIAELDGTFYALKLVSENPEGYVFEKFKVTPGLRTEGYIAIETGDENWAADTFLVKGVFAMLTNE